MLNTIKQNVLIPLLGRLGTAAGTMLAGYGVHADTAQQMPIVVTAIGLVAYDLVFDWLQRRNAKSGQR